MSCALVAEARRGMIARAVALPVLLLLTHALVGVAEAGSWVVIHPDLYFGPPGFRAVWHRVWQRNTWVVVAAYDNAKACEERAGRDSREGSLPLEEFRARRFASWTDVELYTMKLMLMQARCMPTELAEKIGTLRVSEMVR